MKLFKKQEISQGIKDLARQMKENPVDWVQEEYYFRNQTHTDIAIWTCNGYSSLHFNGNEGLNTAEKIYLNIAIKQSIANKLIS